MKRIITLILFSLVITTGPLLCYDDVSPSDVYARLVQGDTLLLLDVREAIEYFNGHIAEPDGFLPITPTLMPWNSDVLENEYSRLPSDKDIIVYCQSGGRSALASNFLETNGFTRIFNMVGGFSSWTYEIRTNGFGDHSGQWISATGVNPVVITCFGTNDTSKIIFPPSAVPITDSIYVELHFASSKPFIPPNVPQSSMDGLFRVTALNRFGLTIFEADSLPLVDTASIIIIPEFTGNIVLNFKLKVFIPGEGWQTVPSNFNIPAFYRTENVLRKWYNGEGYIMFSLTVSIEDGWNMVSIPGLHPTNQDVTTWWSNLTGSVFKFSGGYVSTTTAATGEGYWMKNSGAEIYNYPAIEIVTHDPIPALTGWNMIGGYENSAAVSGLTTNPPGLISGSVFGYSGGYVPATNLVPGYGYWIKLTGDGVINIPSTPLSKGSGEVVEYIQDDWGKITITDNGGKSYTLYAVKGEVDLNNYELPPMPPAGTFDIRYGSGRIAEDISSNTQSINMTGIEYPVRVKVENMSITLQDETGKKINENVKSGEEITISNTQINKLMVSTELMPDKYVLYQNYPNPFNPSTTIKFALPQDSKVNLIIYSILGEEVGQLINQEMKAGYHHIEFNASTLASGVYLYRLQAGSFVETKKMVLMK